MTAVLPCPLRTQTVTAPQDLFLMNSEQIDKASVQLAERLRKESGGDIGAAVDLGYQIRSRTALARREGRALTYVRQRSGEAEGLRLAAVQSG